MYLKIKSFVVTFCVILFARESYAQLQLATAPKSKPLDAARSKPTTDAKSRAEAAKPATYQVGGPRPNGDSTNDDGLLGSLLKIIFGGSKDEDEGDSYERFEKRKEEEPSEPSIPRNPEQAGEELNEERQRQEEEKKRQEEERRTRYEERVREHKRKNALRINTEAGRETERKSYRKSQLGRGIQDEEESNTEISLTPEKQVDTQISSPACDVKSSDDMNKIVELRTKLDQKLTSNSMVYNYSRGDNYPLRWLISCNYEVEKCVDTIAITHVKWRESLEVDTINELDWSEYDTNFPLYHSTMDKDGRPVVEFWLKEWNVASAPSIPQLARWFVKMFELVTRQMYQLNVLQQRCTTQSIMLVDVEDFSEEKQGCEKCLQLYSLFAAIYETHYPNLFMNIHFINADQNNKAFVKMLTQMVGALKQRDRALSSFKLHYEKEQWMKDLDKIIDKAQRSERFGGTKKF